MATSTPAAAVKLLRPTWAEISLPALRRNFERVRRLAGARRVMAVIKADAYGHGAVAVARCLAGCGVDWLGVATVEEAVELREAGIEQPILLLGGLYMSDPADLVEYRLTPSISSTARLDTYAACAQGLGRSIPFHLKIDTGLGRLGLPPGRVPSFLAHYVELDGLELKGIFTHLASAEDLVATQTDEQLAHFQAALKELPWYKVQPEWVHVSNSAALLARPDIHENLVRVGALLYGYCLPLVLPSNWSDMSAPAGRHGAAVKAPEASEFEPVLAFKSRVVYLKDVPSNTPLGYGAAFHSRRPSRIATVPVGYADGLSRQLSSRGRAIVNDDYARIVGNISMDLALLDVTDIPGVEVGDEVTLIGRSEHCAVTAQEIATEIGTVPYEVLCSIGKRVPRIYVDEEGK
ncbi:MAG TPA: alanine racemase [Terriglobia bacterium]|jgi:alanine racemase|nr:alanine racemase [Terriglobia bacterium]